MNRLYVKNLKQLFACQEGIDFFIRNKLDGIPFKALDIFGDYYGYFNWLKCRNISINSDGNVDRVSYGSISGVYVYEDGYPIRFQDLNGNVIHEYDWDSNGNRILYANYHDKEFQHTTYNENNQIAKVKSNVTSSNSKIIEHISNNYNLHEYNYDEFNRLIYGKLYNTETKDIYHQVITYTNYGYTVDFDDGKQIKVRLDDIGNIIQVDYNKYSYNHHEDGQLHTICKNGMLILYIPWFEKVL